MCVRACVGKCSQWCEPPLCVTDAHVPSLPRDGALIIGGGWWGGVRNSIHTLFDTQKCERFPAIYFPSAFLHPF